MKEIPLTRGYVAIVDDEDYERVQIYHWCVAIDVRADGSLSVYARRDSKKSDGSRFTILLHRFILEAPDGLQVDHINGDSLDNRRCNLRLCTHSENCLNKRVRSGCSSQFKGVYWHKKYKVWIARIGFKGHLQYLGRFQSEVEAAITYDFAARKFHGAFARTNFQETARDPLALPLLGVGV